MLLDGVCHCKLELSFLHSVGNWHKNLKDIAIFIFIVFVVDFFELFSQSAGVVFKMGALLSHAFLFLTPKTSFLGEALTFIFHFFPILIHVYSL